MKRISGHGELLALQPGRQRDLEGGDCQHEDRGDHIRSLVNDSSLLQVPLRL